MLVVRILTDKMQSIVTEIGAVRFILACVSSAVCISLCLAAPGNGFWFRWRRHGFERSWYFRAKPCQHQWCLGDQCGCGFWWACLFWNAFQGLAAVGMLLTRGGLLGNFLSCKLRRKEEGQTLLIGYQKLDQYFCALLLNQSTIFRIRTFIEIATKLSTARISWLERIQPQIEIPYQHCFAFWLKFQVWDLVLVENRTASHQLRQGAAWTREDANSRLMDIFSQGYILAELYVGRRCSCGCSPSTARFWVSPWSMQDEIYNFSCLIELN